MPQAANIALVDATAALVTHTFVPLGPDANGVFWWEDQSSPSAIGFWRIGVSLTRPKPGKSSTNDRVYRAKIQLSEPVLEALGTASTGYETPPTVAYVTRGHMEFILPERSLLIDRKNIRKMAASLLSDSQLLAVIENLQFIY